MICAGLGRERDRVERVRRGHTTAGDVTVARVRSLVLDDSDIRARATTGRGGNIRIEADTIVRGPGSTIDASADTGIDGTVETSTPEVDLADSLVLSPSGFLAADSLLGQGCAARRTGAESSFTREGGAGCRPRRTSRWPPGRGRKAEQALRVGTCSGSRRRGARRAPGADPGLGPFLS